MSQANASREGWIDALRLAAGCSMVVLHATADPTGQPFPAATEAQRIAPMVLRAVVYTARTELFLMISIFLLLASLERRPRPWPATMAEQARRLLVPYAFWLLFYAGWNFTKAHAFGYADALAAQFGSPLTIADWVLLGSVKYHMHFLPTLFGLLALYPLFGFGRRHAWAALAAVLALLAIKRGLDLWIWRHLTDWPLRDFLLRAVKIVTYAGYGIAAAAFLGLHRQARREEGRRLLRRLAPWAILVGLGLFLIKLEATRRTIVEARWPFDWTPGYWADFLMPVLLFLLAMLGAARRWPAWLSRLAPYSFGLYLCHPIFMDLSEILLRDSSLSPIAFVLAKLVLVFPATALLVALIARSRLLAWTIGLGPLPTPSLRTRGINHA